MKIPEWKPKDQYAKLGKNRWSVYRLIDLSKEFPVMEIPVDALNIYNRYENLTLREMVMHINAVLDVDKSNPIILDEDGEIMDGRHRIMSALLSRQKTIKAVRFDENPKPCIVDEN